MTVRPILFSDAMVKAILEGRKTQTRRVMKPQPQEAPNGLFHVFNSAGGTLGVSEEDVRSEAIDYVPYEVGDLLYVREAWRCNGWATDLATIFYRASENDGYTAMCEQFPVEGKKRLRVEPRWHPSIHMPRWASRLTLVVTDVRVERLQAISLRDASAEGLPGLAWVEYDKPSERFIMMEQIEFRDLWETLNARRGFGWEADPWVIAVSFVLHKANVDELVKDGSVL